MTAPSLYTTHEGGIYLLWDYGEISKKDLIIPKTNLIAMVGYTQINKILLHSLHWLKGGVVLQETDGKFIYHFNKDFKARWDCFNGWTLGADNAT